MEINLVRSIPSPKSCDTISIDIKSRSINMGHEIGQDSKTV